MYQFKKLLFSTDNDFVLWHIASNSDLVEKMLKDKNLKLTMNNQPVTINVFAHNSCDPEKTGLTAQKHRVNFIGYQKDVWIGKWQYARFCQLEKQSHSSKFKPF